jgi:hypothetical protein
MKKITGGRIASASPAQPSGLTLRPKPGPSMQNPVGPRAGPLPYFMHLSSLGPAHHIIGPKFSAQARPTGMSGWPKPGNFRPGRAGRVGLPMARYAADQPPPRRLILLLRKTDLSRPTTTDLPALYTSLSNA